MAADKSKKEHSDTKKDEAGRILRRVASESETLGSSSMARSANKLKDHLSGADNPDDDKIEILGKRIGRGLSALAFVALAIYLVSTYVLK